MTVMECLMGTVSTSLLKSVSMRRMRLLHRRLVGIISMAIRIMQVPLILNAPTTRREKQRVFQFGVSGESASSIIKLPKLGVE